MRAVSLGISCCCFELLFHLEHLLQQPALLLQGLALEQQGTSARYEF